MLLVWFTVAEKAPPAGQVLLIDRNTGHGAEAAILRTSRHDWVIMYAGDDELSPVIYDEVQDDHLWSLLN